MTFADELEKLFAQAMSGDRDALGGLLQHLRPQLREMARRRLAGKLKGRIDESDLVQQSCLSAFRNFDQFSGEAMADFVGWLKKIHQRNIADTIRDNAVYEKRSISRETNDADAVLKMHAQTSSPSRAAIHSERAAQIESALAQIPDRQAKAVRLRHLEGATLAEIGAALDCSEEAAAGLLRRGLNQLKRKLLKPED